MFINKYLSGLIVCSILIFTACTKWDDYKKYQDGGEIIYSGKGDTVIVNGGRNRVLINWKLSKDPNVAKYILYWNNGSDSISADIPPGSIGNFFPITLNNLTEGNNNFLLYSITKNNQRSVPYIFSGKVFGTSYENSLLNTRINNYDYTNGLLNIYWNKSDSIFVKTKILYTNTSGTSDSTFERIDSGAVTSISNWKIGTPLYYQTSYMPKRSSIDTFSSTFYDTLMLSIMVNKSMWKNAKMPTDAVTDAYGTSLEKIWDGMPGDYPNIYHTDGSHIPHHFTIDLGSAYSNISYFEEIGRTNPGHNPDKFEIWGIEDTVNATTLLPSDDAGWSAESTAKGWTLVTTINRIDNGVAPHKVALPEGLPPIRFVRIRVLHTIDQSKESHMSELSFWYKP